MNYQYLVNSHFEDNALEKGNSVKSVMNRGIDDD